MYLSGKTSQFFQHPDLYGCMFSYRTTGRQFEALANGCKWMLDNGAFTGNFNFEKWVLMLIRMKPYAHNCFGVVVPDVPYNAAQTLEKFHTYAPVVRELGYRVAFVTQNGLTVNDTPWGDFDVLFVGGDDAHKRGSEARALIAEAKSRGIYVHVGRVSSGDSIGQYWPIADSWDGTTFTYEKAGGISEGKKMQRMNKVIKNIQRGEYHVQQEMTI